MRVKITKLGVAKNAMNETASWDEYRVGDNAKSLPVDYELTGELLREPRVGEDLYVHRDTRNGVKKEGLFQSSPVVSKEPHGEGLKLCTANSVYLMKPLGGEERSL